MDVAPLIPSVLPLLLGLALGFASWGLLEYAIHGFLSHRLRTPVSPIHWGHHRTSVGIEDVADLIADLDQALNAAEG